jgi:hypothetical protein
MNNIPLHRRLLFIFLLSLFCLAAAFVFRKMIYEIVIVPLAYLWWLITLYYHLLPQLGIWILLIFVVLFTATRGLLMEIQIDRTVALKKKVSQGPVESLSSLIQKSERGSYYKWIIANRLGKVARELLDQREGRQIKQKFTRLTSRDWNPPEEVAGYLEAGLNGSFADYPKRSWSRAPHTPLDVNQQQVIEYLESEMENHRNGYR